MLINHFFSIEEMKILKKEIFTKEIYYTELDQDEPVIIDAGAYIGLSTLYFKSIYPKAKVIAIEPNPYSFELLKKNVNESGFDNIVLLNAAVSKRKEGKEVLFMDETDDRWFSTSGRFNGAWNGKQKSKSYEVDRVYIRDLLKEKVDLLKLDIEGMEQSVLKEADKFLCNVKNLIIEYHPVQNQVIDKVLKILRSNGFEYSIYNKGSEVAPKELVKNMVIIRSSHTNCCN